MCSVHVEAQTREARVRTDSDRRLSQTCSQRALYLILVVWALLIATATWPARVEAQGCDAAPESVHSANPVLRRNFPDPFLLESGGCVYAFASNSNRVNVQVAVSRDLRAWSAPGEAMPKRPAWVREEKPSQSPDVWAPEVIPVGDHYVLFFSARHKDLRTPAGDNRPCLGVAIGSHPSGPFEARPRPLICRAFQTGVIDPSPFRDRDGRLYLYFKQDGNCCHLRTEMYAQRLAASGLRLVGPSRALGLHNNPETWEGPLIEAPTMISHDGAYVLLFSGSWFDKADYATGFARCATPLGRCQKSASNPILKTSGRGTSGEVLGPGHQAVLRYGGRTYIAYHSWLRLPPEKPECRAMSISELQWLPGGSPSVQPAVESGWTCLP